MSPDYRRRIPEQEHRGHSSSEAAPAADPFGKLDQVLTTLERMLAARGAPPAPSAPSRRDAPAAEPADADDDSIPLLQDVATPVSGGRPGALYDPSTAGRPEPDTPPSDTAASRTDPYRAPMRFEIEGDPDEDLPRLGDLRLVGGSGYAEPQAQADGERYGDSAPPALEPEVYRHLVDRLANEIDVIVQTGTEEAMHRAATEIADKVREHVAIVLPEIIEELARLSDDRPAG